MNYKSSNIQTNQNIFETNWEERVEDFEKFGLSNELILGIYNNISGTKQLTDIEALAIKPILMGKNIIAQAPLRSGKTTALVIGILGRIDTKSNTTQALVLSPTHNITSYIYKLFVEIGSKLQNLKVQLFSNVHKIKEDQKHAQELPHIVVSTPQRALDLISTGYLRCENIKIACVDDAELILSDIDIIEDIFRYLNVDVQFMLFSPEYSNELMNIMSQFIYNPVKIIVRPVKPVKPDNIFEKTKQFYVYVEPENKFPTLIDIYGTLSIQNAIIFANSKETVEYLEKQLKDNDFPVSAIHGGMNKIEIEENWKKFRRGETRCLILSDFDNSRCLHFAPQLTLIINFELPISNEKYLDRLRICLGPKQRMLCVINICDKHDMRVIRHIKRMYKTDINEISADIGDIVRDANSQFD